MIIMAAANALASDVARGREKVAELEKVVGSTRWAYAADLALEHTGAYGGALNMTMDQMMDLFPKMGAGVKDVVDFVASIGFPDRGHGGMSGPYTEFRGFSWGSKYMSRGYVWAVHRASWVLLGFQIEVPGVCLGRTQSFV